MREKTRRLIRLGEKVSYIICHNEEGEHFTYSDIGEADHFLYQQLKRDFPKEVRMEFVKADDLDRVVSERMLKDDSNVMVDEFHSYDPFEGTDIPSVEVQ